MTGPDRPGARGARTGALLALLGCLACTVLVARSGGIVDARWGLFAVVAAWLVLSVAATAATVRLRHGGAGLVVVAALILQTVAVAAGPQLSDDLYRYVWDARVAAAGVDPYGYPPDAQALVPLRDPRLWPSVQDCTAPRAQLPAAVRQNPFAGTSRDTSAGAPAPFTSSATGERRPDCTQMNRPDARTIYPPTAQLAFRVAAAGTPETLAVERQVQLPAAVASLLLTGLLLVMLHRTRRAPGWALLYAASPLAALEAGMDAHVDVLAGLFGLGVLLLLARDGSTGRERLALSAGAGLLLSLAVLVKLYPAALGAVVVSRWGWRSARTWICFGSAAVAALLLYLPHVLAVGLEVVGYLPGYLRENGYDTGGGRYLLLQFLPAGIAPAVALLGLAGLVAWSVTRRVPADLGYVCARAALVLGSAFLILTPGNAWYCTLLVCCALLGGRPEWVSVVLANYTGTFASILGAGLLWPTVSYAAAAAAVVTAELRRRRQRTGQRTGQRPRRGSPSTSVAAASPAR